MPDVPSETLMAETSIQAGVQALERIHGRHLADMSQEEQAEARQHWREQVEEVLHAVHSSIADPDEADGRGSAVIVFVDGQGDQIDVSVRFSPELKDLGNDQVEGTAAQILALTALAAVEENTEPE